jgi:hypothetical protein
VATKYENCIGLNQQSRLFREPLSPQSDYYRAVSISGETGSSLNRYSVS